MAFWRRRFPAWTLALAVVLAVLLSNRGFRRLVSNASELRRLRGELSHLQQEETTLRSSLDKARRSDFALEGAARRELGYLKPGEVEYRFPPPKKP